MNMLGEGRLRRKLSQRRLARMASLSYKTLQLIETGRHNPRLSSLEKVARAFGFPPGDIERTLCAHLSSSTDSVEAVSARMAAEGESSWKHWLFELVDAFRRQADAALFEAPPRPALSPRVRCLLAATVEALCAERGLTPPWWCGGVGPLPVPWFVSGSESLKALALVESPLEFRKRNLFVLANFLARA